MYPKYHSGNLTNRSITESIITLSVLPALESQNRISGVVKRHSLGQINVGPFFSQLIVWLQNTYPITRCEVVLEVTSALGIPPRGTPSLLKAARLSEVLIIQLFTICSFRISARVLGSHRKLYRTTWSVRVTWLSHRNRLVPIFPNNFQSIRH